jgi:hypothetical protein
LHPRGVDEVFFRDFFRPASPLKWHGKGNVSVDGIGNEFHALSAIGYQRWRLTGQRLKRRIRVHHSTFCVLCSARLANEVAKCRKTNMVYHPVSANGNIV